MHWLEHGRVLSFWIEIGRRRQADGANHGGAEVRQNVPEQIRRDDYVKPVGMANKVSGQNVNVVLIGSNVGETFRDTRKPFIPERHSVNNSIRLGR